jgi:dTDP-4-amino-4,6-dideoxygalactose transaminase
MDIENIAFALPYLGEEEEAGILRVLRSGWLTTGKEALEFEKEFAAFLQAKAPNIKAPLTALAVNSATSGLHLALEAVGTGPGDIVLVPSYTFTSTAEVVRYLGAEVVFVDVKPGTFLIDCENLEKTLERLMKGLPAYPSRDGKGEGFGPIGKPCAVIPVHFAGLVCDMETITELAETYHISVIEDAAHAFPSLVENGSAGGCIGDIGVFSFYATKTITTGEGGMIVTANPELAKRMSVMRSHGIDRNVWNRYTDTKASWYYEVIEPGFKYNLPDLLAAVGRAQLKRALDLFNMRKEIAKQYDEAFINDERFLIPPRGYGSNAAGGESWHLYPLRLKSEYFSITRDEFINQLKEKGIHVSVHFIPLHVMPYYRDRYGLRPEDFPETLSSFKAEISLPIWPGMTESQITKVIECIKNIADKHKKERSSNDNDKNNMQRNKH